MALAKPPNVDEKGKKEEDEDILILSESVIALDSKNGGRGWSNWSGYDSPQHQKELSYHKIWAFGPAMEVYEDVFFPVWEKC